MPFQSISSDLSALYGPSVHMLPTLVHCAVVNVFKGTTNLKPLSWAVDRIQTRVSLKG